MIGVRHGELGMTGPGRPRIGAVHEIRVPDELWEPLGDEARDNEVSVAEMLRRILTERYEEGT